MSTVWAQRREELLSDCLVSSNVFSQMVDRLSEFVVPYQQVLEAESIVKLTSPSIQPLLPVAYSPLWHYHRSRTCIGQTHGMMAPSPTQLYKRHRFPAEIISHGVWLYFRFSLSYRDVQEMMAERGVIVSHEAVRYWSRTFGQEHANELCRKRPRPGDTWFLDEVFVTISGTRSRI